MTTTEPAPLTDPAEILDVAATLIEERGWTQGVYWNNEGCHCAIGAIAEATGVNPAFSINDAFLNARDTLAKTLGFTSPAQSIVEWNDDSDRTQQEVVAALRKAATNIRTRLAEAS